MDAANEAVLLAKLTWTDPVTGEAMELTLAEGGTASIGRLETNDICIKEHHVSRQHAIINYQDGVFVITDQGSANGVFVNDQRLTEPFPLAAGDVIRLYVPIINFSALVTEEEQRQASDSGLFVMTAEGEGTGRLIVTNGPQEGSSIPLLLDRITIGRATTKANWEICLQDPSVSRPHARLERADNNWVLYDLGSANGTAVNGTPVNEKGRALHDGDEVTLGSTSLVFRSS